MAPRRAPTAPTLDQVAEAVAEVPALPLTVQRVMDACAGGDADARAVSEMILADQGLTANVLKLANSAYYGHPRRVTTVTDAVVLLGMSAIRSLALSSHTARLLSRPLPGYAMARGDLWRHSLAVAFVSRRLAAEGAAVAVEEAFVAGLLHDLGKVVLSDFLGDGFEELTVTAHRRRIPLHVAERELLGFDHADVGARIAGAWRFPPPLVEAIGMHHRPAEAAVAPALTHTVCAADAACRMVAAGVGPDAVPLAVDPLSLEAAGVTAARLAALIAELEPVITADPESE